MRSPTALSVFARREPARTTSCGRCGDSFSGSALDGRTWLAAHKVAEHPPILAAVPAVTSFERPAQRTAPVLREQLS